MNNLKIETCKDGYKIFVNSCLLSDINMVFKDDLINYTKNLIYKLKTKLSLRGFYKVKVFTHTMLGLFIEIIKLDESDFSSNLDLRIVVFLEEKFYFKTDDYFLINNCKEIRYSDKMFFCLVDESFDELLEKVEFGSFIYGKDVNKLLNNSRLL